MAEHPSITLSALLSAGGVAGYLKTGSRPSLIAGLGLGVSYAFSGYLLKQNKDYGAELALANSVVLLGAGASRTIKTKAKAPVPIGLATAGLLASLYYAKKVKEFRYGV